MPAVAIFGAYLGATTIGAALGGGIIGGIIGGAIGGGIGGGIGAEIMGGNFSDGFKSGAIGGALSGGIAGWGAVGSATGGASQAGMLAEQYAGFDAATAAAHMADSGLSAAQMVETLGSMGVDYNTAADLVQSAPSSQFSTPTGDYLDLVGGDPSITSFDQQFGGSPEGYLNSYGNTPFNDGGYGVTDATGAGSIPFESTVGGSSPYSIDSGLTAQQLSMPASQAHAGGMLGGEAPSQGYDFSGGSTGMAPSSSAIGDTSGLGDLFKGIKSKFDNLMPGESGGIPGTSKGMGGWDTQMAMAGMQTVQDYMNAGKLQNLADQAAVPYNKYMETFDNPDMYWNEYINGVGGQQMNTAASQMAKAGRTGMLPTLRNQAYSNYTSNYLPTVRTGLAGGANMASANMQQQTAPMTMQNRALANIPSVYQQRNLMDLYGKMYSQGKR